MQALLNKEENFEKLTQSDNSDIASGRLTLAKIVEIDLLFNIPIYQRLYVWKVNQIRTLLEDLRRSFLNNSQHNFFLGGVMLSSNESSQIDLIDGQQRFTTIWLLCDLLSTQGNENLRKFTHNKNNQLRINFSIREIAQRYLQDKSSFKDFFDADGEIITTYECEVNEIIPLIKGQQFIKGILDDFTKEIPDSFDLQAFSDYIFSKIVFTYTFLPSKSDMNRVFEAMNNRGKQLEHHEILKSRLLQKINFDERINYSLIWDACSVMDSYIEKSLKDVAELTWNDIFEEVQVNTEDFNSTDRRGILDQVDIMNRLKLKNSTKPNTISLKDILDDNTSADKDPKKKEELYTDHFVNSIISFPTLLIHVLRIHQLQNNVEAAAAVEVNEKKLLQIFDKIDDFDSEDKVKHFIHLLWRSRVLFDQYVIKWIRLGGTKLEYHSIEQIQLFRSTKKNKKEAHYDAISVQRVEPTNEHIKCLVKLQGMLYHSQEMSTQYWLTPFLYVLHAEHKTEVDVLKELERLENSLFYSTKNIKPLRERTFSIAKADLKEEITSSRNSNDHLSEFLGTDYSNYIFYKLEYILWKNRIAICKEHGLDINKWNSYRLTSKNSVEHIFPQNSREENKHIEYLDSTNTKDSIPNAKNALDDFGNLVLLSPGMNSEYSNLPYKQKKAKHDSKAEVDSLKSDLIFKHTDWNWKLAYQHRNNMITLIEQYVECLK